MNISWEGVGVIAISSKCDNNQRETILLIVTPCEFLSLRNTFINLTSLGQVMVGPQGAGS